MVNIRIVIQIVKQGYSLIINKLMEELDIDWISKTNLGNA